MNKMKIILGVLFGIIFQFGFAQNSEKAVQLLDEVSAKMGAYENMYIGFSTSLVNKAAGINENDEPPINGKITLQGDKYYLDYIGNTFIYDGNKLYVINHDIKEVTINDEDISEEEGFIYPNKMLTFYKEGYRIKMGEMKNEKGRMLQYVDLFPIDSNSSITKVTLGIDKESKHIYKMIQTGENGAVTTLTINQFKSNQELSPTLFSFDRKKYEKLDYLID